MQPGNEVYAEESIATASELFFFDLIINNPELFIKLSTAQKTAKLRRQLSD